jgi:hypothetical protein
MTVRTRKTIVDLISGLKAQEKEIKSQLSDSQRRLNEVRDRIATCYWIIEEVADVGDYDPQDDECYRLNQGELQVWRNENPHLTEEQLENLITNNGWLMPLSTVEIGKTEDPCDCADCCTEDDENFSFTHEEWEEISKEDWEELVKTHPNLSGGEINDIMASMGFVAPEPYAGCPCPDCASTRKKNKQEHKEASKIKEKPKAKLNTKPLPLPKKKPVKKPVKKGKK